MKKWSKLEKAEGKSSTKRKSTWIYASFWSLTAIFMGVFIGVSVAYNHDVNFRNKEYQNFSRRVDIVEKVPPKVISENSINENTYYVQAQENDDLNGNGIYSEAEGDIVLNKFYPLWKVKDSNQLLPNGNEIWNFRMFHKDGYWTPKVVVKKNVTVASFDEPTKKISYVPGDMVSLRDLYADPQYNGNPVQSQSYLDCFSVVGSNGATETYAYNYQDRTTAIPMNEEFGDIKGQMAYDLERIKPNEDFVLQDKVLDPILKPTDEAKHYINVVAAIGVTFAALLTSAVFSTVIVVIYQKRNGGVR